jgi:hypothetical protein
MHHSSTTTEFKKGSNFVVPTEPPRFMNSTKMNREDNNNGKYGYANEVSQNKF